MDKSLIEETFDDIILGRGVKRFVHDLVFQGTDYSAAFIEQLKKLNYLPKELKSIKIEVGYRIPGFLIKESKAYFGHVFWEVFSEKRKKTYDSLLAWTWYCRTFSSSWTLYPFLQDHVLCPSL